MKKSDNAKLVTVIPIRNEEIIIERLHDEIINFVTIFNNLNFILALDNCTDNTESILNRVLKNEKIVVIKSNSKPGYGNIIRQAFKKADSMGFEWALVIDSDLSNPLEEIIKVENEIRNLHDTQVVILKGNRFSKLKPDFIGVPAKRFFFSTSANIFTRIFGSKYSNDLTNGFRAVNLDWFRSQNLIENGFPSIVEEAYEALKSGGKIKDFKTILRYDQALRVESSFTFDLKLLINYSKYVIKIWTLNRRLN
jgi:hypothetical protein